MSIFWKASDNCLITTQALTNLSKVMPTACAAGGRPPNPGILGGGAAGDALNISSPEEGQLAITDIIEPDRHVKKGKGITVFPLDELEELRGQVISELFEGGLQLCTVD